MKKTAATHFVSNPKSDVLHITKDKQAFFTEHDAKNHAKHIAPNGDDEARKIETVKRSEVSEEIAELVDEPVKNKRK